MRWLMTFQQVNRLAISPEYSPSPGSSTEMHINHCFSKRLLAAAIHKKVNIYEVASTANEPVRTLLGSEYTDFDLSP